jgi:exopolysaccharide biosynthesis polyprenyl glycosylphosphotransferase
MGASNIVSGLASAGSYSGGRRVIRIEGLQLFDVLEIAFDFSALAVAWHAAFWLRLWLNPVMTQQLTPERLLQVAPPIGGLLALWLLMNVWLIVSGRDRRVPGGLNIFRLSESVLLVSAISIIVTFFSRELGAAVSRSFVLLYAPISYMFLIFARAMEHRTWVHIARSWPSVLERVAIIGSGKSALDVAERIRNSEAGSTELVGVILPPGCSGGGAVRAHASVLGSTLRLAELINAKKLSRILVLRGSLPESEFQRCTAVAKRMGVVLSREVNNSFTDVMVTLEKRFGMQLVAWRPVSCTRAEELLKRIADLVLSSTLLIITAPILVVAMALIKITSRGPIFYNSIRVGRGGRHFTFYKLRTMYSCDATRTQVVRLNERGGHIFKVKRDPRVTPIGRFMRRYSIDELPQLMNVVLGHMSILGPRPLPAEDLDADGMSRQYPKWAEMRALVKPGITGLWQVSGRSDLPFEQMIHLDLEYIHNWSLLLDARILLATPLVVLTGRGAY